jgi:hypothetical protein
VAGAGSAASFSIEPGIVERDGEDVLRFCLDGLPGFTRDRYVKYYELSPYGVPEFVVARAKADGRVVGVAALHPQQVLVDGQPHAAAVAGDFAVETGQRGFGPALAMQRELVSRLDSRGWLLAYGLPNRAAASVLRRVGYVDLGAHSRFTRRLTRFERLAATVGLVVRRVPRGHSIERPAQFDDRFGHIWAESGRRVAYLPACTAAALNWRFELSPGPRKRFSLTVAASGAEPRAYSVATVAYGVRRVVELGWVDDASLRDVVAAELAHAARARLGGVDLLYLGRREAVMPVLGPLGFTESPAPTVIVHAVQADDRRATDPGSWQLFEGGTDV